jgi:hypothetical protein
VLTAGIRKIRIQGDKVKMYQQSALQDVVFSLKTQRNNPLRIETVQ